MKILVVEDEEMMRELLVTIFEDDPVEVVCAADGEEALEKYFAFRPDIILLDVMMPKLDGFEVCRKIQFEENDDSTIIHLLTGMGGDVKAKGEQVGANSVLPKPFLPNQVRELVFSGPH